MQRFLLGFLSCLIAGLLTFPLLAAAQVGTQQGASNDPGTGTGNTPSIQNPLGNVGDPRVLVGKIISAALGVVGSISLVIFLYGGFTWMTSGGSPDKVKHGRDLIVWAAIGLFVIFASYAMVRWVLETITAGTR